MGWTEIYRPIDETSVEVGVVSDDAWDIMANAIEQIQAAYQEKGPGRNPKVFELEQIFYFVIGPLIDEESQNAAIQ